MQSNLSTIDIRGRLTQLGDLLRRLESALWAVLDASESSPSEQEHARTVVARLCDSIDGLAGSAVKHFSGVNLHKGLRLVVRSATLAKAVGHPIAGTPGVALLPAPTNPAVERWQRLQSLKENEPPESAGGAMAVERLTASHTDTLVRPSSDYEAFLAKQLSPQTRRAYVADMRHFLDAAGIDDPEELAHVGPETLIAYRNAMLEAGTAPATIGRRLSTLRSFFSMLVTLGRMEQNPADPKIVRSPRIDREGKTPGIEPHEARRMLKAPDTGTLIGKRAKAILAAGLYLGLRREEIANLDLSDLRDERSHHVLEVRGKGGKTRVLPVPPAAYSAIVDYLSATGRTLGGSGPLIVSLGHAAAEGARLSGRDVWNIVRKYADQAGVNREISPHSMRVAAITSALDHGAPIHRVQIMAGHADPRTTTRYYRAGEELDESATYAIRY